MKNYSQFTNYNETYYDDEWGDYRKVDGKRRKGNTIQNERRKKMKVREEFFEESDDE